MKNLKSLDISANKVQSLRGLGELTSLVYLKASNNKIPRLSKYLVQKLVYIFELSFVLVWMIKQYLTHQHLIKLVNWILVVKALNQESFPGLIPSSKSYLVFILIIIIILILIMVRFRTHHDFALFPLTNYFFCQLNGQIIWFLVYH